MSARFSSVIQVSRLSAGTETMVPSSAAKICVATAAEVCSWPHGEVRRAGGHHFGDLADDRLLEGTGRRGQVLREIGAAEQRLEAGVRQVHLDHRPDHPVDQFRQRQLRRGGIERLPVGGSQLGPVALAQRVGQRLLVREELVQRARGHPGLLGDRVRRRLGITDLREHHRRGIGELRHPALTARLPTWFVGHPDHLSGQIR